MRGFSWNLQKRFQKWLSYGAPIFDCRQKLSDFNNFEFNLGLNSTNYLGIFIVFNIVLWCALKD